MTKVCLITDSHWGIRGGSRSFANNQKEFYKYCFFPYLDSHPEIKTIWHLGDAFDKRKNIDFVVLQEAKEMFYDPARERNLQIEEIAGNHDVYHRNTNRVNAPELIIAEQYDNVNIIAHEVESLVYDNRKVDFVPWFHGTDMEQDIIDYLKHSDSDILVGHLELSGFPMNPGVINLHGLDPDTLRRYDMVLSGHFHTRSQKGHITYLGAPTEYDWGDYGDPRGFHVLDLEDMSLEFIENPHKMFYKFVITKDFDISKLGCHLTNKQVRAIQGDTCSVEKFDSVIDEIRSYSPNDLDIIERDELESLRDLNEDDSDPEIISTQEFIVNAVSDMDLTSHERDEMIGFLSSLYTESLDE
jgi:DNA repair exonuclease SbcCD nuclease subunit